MQTEIELLNYLKNFIISKEIFNINIKPNNIDINKNNFRLHILTYKNLYAI